MLSFRMWSQILFGGNVQLIRTKFEYFSLTSDTKSFFSATGAGGELPAAGSKLKALITDTNDNPNTETKIHKYTNTNTRT